MGVIDICSGSSCLIKPQIKLNFTHLDTTQNCCLFERNQSNWASCMSATAPVTVSNVKKEEQRLTGDSFSVLSTRLGRKPEDIVKLDANENPYGSPPEASYSIIDDKALLRILDLLILVVLDEAYVEFSGIESRMQWVKKHENLIILQKFSKRAALAGLRVGYGAFPLSIIEYLWRAKHLYNVSIAAEVSACAALSNPTYLETVKVALVQERERLFRHLEKVPFLNPYPSYSNFILCEVTSRKDAKKLKGRPLKIQKWV